MTSGQRYALQARKRLEDHQFYVSLLTELECSILAARYLRRLHNHPPQVRLSLIRSTTLEQLALCEVFAEGNYGRWS